MTGPAPFALVPRRRFVGTPFGSRRSARRGAGDEVGGTRPYRPGDLRAHIHWPASARLSAARGTDEFVVREFYADEAPWVAVAVDRRPGMDVRPASPWLDKRAAADAAVTAIAASARAVNAPLVQPGEPTLRRELAALVRRAAELPTGSFVFAVSDFLEPLPSAADWLHLRALRWDVVPVVVQDPVWEQSFPRVGGVALPVAGPDGRGGGDLWLSARDARERAGENEQRFAGILARFRRLGFEPVVVQTNDLRELHATFEAWAERRRRLLRSGRL